jgi:hypothetical protein
VEFRLGVDVEELLVAAQRLVFVLKDVFDFYDHCVHRLREGAKLGRKGDFLLDDKLVVEDRRRLFFDP